MFPRSPVTLLSKVLAVRRHGSRRSEAGGLGVGRVARGVGRQGAGGTGGGGDARDPGRGGGGAQRRGGAGGALRAGRPPLPRGQPRGGHVLPVHLPPALVVTTQWQAAQIVTNKLTNILLIKHMKPMLEYCRAIKACCGSARCKCSHGAVCWARWHGAWYLPSPSPPAPGRGGRGRAGISNAPGQTRDMSRDGDDDDVHVTLRVTLPTSRHTSHTNLVILRDQDLNGWSSLAFRSQIKYLSWR